MTDIFENKTALLENGIDIAVIFTVENANPNGDPNNGNRPREDSDGFGEVSDVCFKRKIRNRLDQNGKSIFVKDDYSSLEKKFEACVNTNGLTNQEIKTKMLSMYLDTRAFGQVITYNKLSIGIKGAISISWIKSLDKIKIDTHQITKSVNGMEKVKIDTHQITKSVNGMEKEGEGKSSDTMGSKSFISNQSSYVAKLSISVELAKKNGLTNQDVEDMINVLPSLFEGDATAARPAGSMWVNKVIVWKHNSQRQCSAHKVFETLKIVSPNGVYQSHSINNVLECVEAIELDGF